MVKRSKEIKGLKGFKEMSSIKNNKNLMNHNMKKAILTNIRYLQGLAKNSKENVGDKISHLIELYKARKIPNITTVEKLILSLRSPTASLIKKALKLYDSIALKYEDEEPLPDKHLRLRKEKAEVKVAQNRASIKITRMLRNALTIRITNKTTSMNGKVIDYTVQFGYTGIIIKYNMTNIMERAFVLVKKELATTHSFKFFSTLRLWSKTSGSLKEPIFSGDFNSNEVNKWLQRTTVQIQAIIQSDDQILLSQSVLKFHFVMQPEGEGGVATDSRNRDSILEKKSVNVIKNTDNNCFWHALAVALNPKNTPIKENRGPQKNRIAVGKVLCQQSKLKWDEPVSFIHIPLVEEALNINIYIIDMDNKHTYVRLFNKLVGYAYV